MNLVNIFLNFFCFHFTVTRRRSRLMKINSSFKVLVILYVLTYL